MQNAWRRTLRKTANWVKSQTAKAVSKETRVPQKVIKKRLFFSMKPGGNSCRVWLGLNPLEADFLGRPRQTRTGVTVGSHRFKSAWIYRSRYSDGGVQRSIKIRRRDGASYYVVRDSEDKKTGQVFERVGRARKPYRRVKYDWSGPGGAAFREAASRVEERVQTILRQEINYEIQKAAGRAR